MESTSHIFSERWGISTLFHVGTTDETTFSRSARGSQRVQDVVFGYFSEFNISTSSCCCTLNFTCLREVLFAEENTAELRSDPGCCSRYVTSIHGQFNANHHRIIRFLSFSLLSMNISSIHRQTGSDGKRKVKMNAELGSVRHMKPFWSEKCCSAHKSNLKNTQQQLVYCAIWGSTLHFHTTCV